MLERRVTVNERQNKFAELYSGNATKAAEKAVYSKKIEVIRP